MRASAPAAGCLLAEQLFQAHTQRLQRSFQPYTSEMPAFFSLLLFIILALKTPLAAAALKERRNSSVLHVLF